MQSSNPIRLSAFLLFIFWIPIAGASEPTPPIVSSSDTESKRQAIQREMDGNHDAVRELYDLLDTTPQDDTEARKFLEDEIQQYDERSNVLFDELDVLDQQDFQKKRHTQLEFQAQRLEAEAVQLRKTNLFLPAATREAKARALRKALSDGSWKRLVRDEWSCDEPKCDERKHRIISVIQLAVQVESLKSETVRLGNEVQRLRELVELLSKKP